MPRILTPEAVLGQKEKILLYGDPGTGKSFLGLTAPEPIYVLAIGGENELKTRYSKEFLARYPERDIIFDVVTEDREEGEMIDNPTGVDKARDFLWEFLQWNEKEGRGVQTIVIDNITSLTELQMNKAISAEFALASDKEKSTLQRERKYGIRRPHDDTWGGAQSLMDKFLNWMLELPFHVIFVCHEWQQTVKSRGTGAETVNAIKPLFIGKHRVQAPRAFDNVWRCTVSGSGRGRTFNVQTVGDDIVSAKTRVGGILSPQERDLDLTEVISQFTDYPKTLK